jgi:murein DD-endopeptidase MepM/ murein hydrolase activator NlpD
MLCVVVPVASAQAGGAGLPSESGGSEYGGLLRKGKPPKPIATLFSASTQVVTLPQLPKLALRIDQPGSVAVAARVVFVPQGPGVLTRVELGSVPTGRRLAVNLPEGTSLAPGRYLVRLHAKGRGGTVLARGARTAGRTTVRVRPAPAPPAPPVAPPVAPAPAVERPNAAGYTFPVVGPHGYGSDDARFGAGRVGHIHEGQDLTAGEGTPVVAPVGAVISRVAFQASGAGHYIVLAGNDGRSYFLAHLQTGSIVVAEGQAVVGGQQLAGVGSTGSSSGPHLHFEIWPAGWRKDATSRPIDPLPELQAWDH